MKVWQLAGSLWQGGNSGASRGVADAAPKEASPKSLPEFE